MKAKNQDAKWRENRMQIRDEYMNLTLYPDEYEGTESERLDQIDELRAKIKKFRYKSVRNFINEVFDDSMNGILDKDVATSIIRYLKGYRDKIEWEAIGMGHRLFVNGEGSPIVDRKMPAEVGGYMAFYKTPNNARILRVFDVPRNMENDGR